VILYARAGFCSAIRTEAIMAAKKKTAKRPAKKPAVKAKTKKK